MDTILQACYPYYLRRADRPFPARSARPSSPRPHQVVPNCSILCFVLSMHSCFNSLHLKPGKVGNDNPPSPSPRPCPSIVSCHAQQQLRHTLQEVSLLDVPPSLAPHRSCQLRPAFLVRSEINRLFVDGQWPFTRWRIALGLQACELIRFLSCACGLGWKGRGVLE